MAAFRLPDPLPDADAGRVVPFSPDFVSSFSSKPLKFNSREMLAQRRDIQPLESASLGIEIHLEIVPQGHELAGHGNAVAELLEILAHLRRKFVQMFEHRLGPAILLDELGRRFRTNTGDSRNIID